MKQQINMRWPVLNPFLLCLFWSGLWGQPADTAKKPEPTAKEAQVQAPPTTGSEKPASEVKSSADTSAQDTVTQSKEPVKKEPVPAPVQGNITADTAQKKADEPDSVMVKSDSTKDTSDTWGAALDQPADSSADTSKSVDSAAVARDTIPAKPEPAVSPLISDKDEYGPKVSKKKKVFRQSRINTIDDMKGQYKSPKKAMFMSLLLPGLGQAYVGSYIRSGLYVIAEGALIFGWRHYVVTKHDRQVRNYRRFAGEHWSHKKYEEKLDTLSGESNFPEPNLLLEALPTRDQYCNAIFTDSQEEGSSSETCKDLGPYDLSNEYSSFPFFTFLTGYEEHDVDGTLERHSGDSIVTFREDNFQDVHNFYELIGKHNEYLPGWDDAEDVEIVEQDENENQVGVFITGSSDNRDEYRSMRAKATEYSRMQSVFLGFMVLNHIVSALDAALTARYHNKKLYETEVKWYDRLQFRSFFAYTNRRPQPGVTATLPF